MARSKETFSKKEIEKKKLQKRKEKAQRKEDRKSNGGATFEDMIAYVDNNGNIISTPPNLSKKEVINEKDIVIGARNSGDDEEFDPIRNGKVTFFNTSKGYGFIRDLETNESIFVHSNGLTTAINENDKVTFEIEQGPRGLNAINVKLIE